jgi:serine/threonine-protein kinase
MATCPTCRRQYPAEATRCEDDGETLLPDEAFAGADADLEPGRMVGEYRVDAKLGEGGFGTVYAGAHPLIGKRAAIKVLKRQWSSNPQMVSRFIAEARAVNQIRHKGIIDIFSFGALEDGRQYYVMELLEGETFDELLKRRGALPVEEAIPILRQVARAIDAAHAAGLAHRDLKPENVFVTMDEDGGPTVKLLDFGIAKLMGDDGMSGHRTRTGTPLGTPHYMSPEQCRGQNVDPRTDTYSFGIMVHQALTGQFPFDGESLVDLLFAQTTAPAPRMSSVRPDLPPALDEPVLRMLEKSPDARPKTLVSAIDALARAAASAGLAVRSGATPGDLSQIFASSPSSRPARGLAEARTVVGATGVGPTSASVALAQADGDRAAEKPSRLPYVIAAIGLVAGLGIAAALAPKGPRTPADAPATPSALGTATATTPAASAAPSAVAAPSATPAVTPEPPAEVAITIAAQPAGTEIFLGAEKLGTAPGPLRIRRDDKELTLTLKAAGYAPRELPVVPSKDKELVAPPPTKTTVAKPAPKPNGRGELENPFQ